jgi:hypothetical protein
MKTSTMQHGNTTITVSGTSGKWTARDQDGHFLARGTTRAAAFAKAIDNLANAGVRE